MQSSSVPQAVEGPLTPEEELLRDLFPEQADHVELRFAPATAESDLLSDAPEFRSTSPGVVEQDAPISGDASSPPAELSAEAYVSLCSLEGLDELEDVAPGPPPSVHLHVEEVSTARSNFVAAAPRELSSTEQTLLHLTRSVEQLTAIVQQLNGTIQVLSQGLYGGGAQLPSSSYAPAPQRPQFQADPGYRLPAPQEVTPAAEYASPPAPAQRSWDPAPPPKPRETPEQWSERLEKFFDAPLPAPTEAPSEKEAQDASRKLSCDVLGALNSHNMKSLDVRVEEEGVVTLRGRVASENMRYLATIVAQRTPGCQKVVNELVVVEETDSSSRLGRYWKSRTPGQMRLHVTAAVALVLLAGGGFFVNGWLRPSVVPATGVVQIDGQPVDGARLVLHPVLTEGQLPRDVRYPTAVTDNQGKFDFTTYRPHDGIPPGEYHVSIEWRRLVEADEQVAPGPNLLPQHYLDPELSGITVKIARDTRELPPITLNW
ncbi:MAG TPA: BON domain-containing protein [Planctomycetaceae bacterium]|nr:BON domain-containing protein [Planctomycetaceae bacterium]